MSNGYKAVIYIENKSRTSGQTVTGNFIIFLSLGACVPHSFFSTIFYLSLPINEIIKMRINGPIKPKFINESSAVSHP